MFCLGFPSGMAGSVHSQELHLFSYLVLPWDLWLSSLWLSKPHSGIHHLWMENNEMVKSTARLTHMMTLTCRWDNHLLNFSQLQSGIRNIKLKLEPSPHPFSVLQISQLSISVRVISLHYNHPWSLIPNLWKYHYQRDFKDRISVSQQQKWHTTHIIDSLSA
jgi:hypothetical protein